MNLFYTNKQSFELLKDCIKSTAETFSLINNAKQKRKEMSNTTTPVTGFKWTDTMVKNLLAEHWNIPVADLSKFIDAQIDHFKSRHSASGSGVDWEILQMIGKAHGPHIPTEECEGYKCDIYSVLRKSDGIVFSIGDELEDGVIKAILIRDINPESTIKQCWIGFSDNDDSGTDLMYAEKAPIPPPKTFVLRTKDEKDIFIGDSFYIVSNEWNLYPQTASEDDIGFWKAANIFSTEEAANVFILVNKPCLCVKDVYKTLVVLSTIFGRDINKHEYNNRLEETIRELAQSKINSQSSTV